MRFSGISKCVVTAVSLMALSVSCAVVAQEIPRGQTVKSRPKPETDPLGIRVRDFLFFPKVSLSDSYDSNIMSAKTDEISDHIFLVDLDGEFRSDWKLHSLKFAGNLKSAQHFDNSDENFNDIKLKADGRYDVSSEFNLTGGTNLLFGHEDRSSTDDAGGIEPGKYTQFTINGGADKTFNRYSIKGGFTVDKYDYDDVKTTGEDVNNDDRDRFETEADIRVGYEFHPESELFSRLEVNNSSYHDDVDDNGVNRDSTGLEVTTGLSFDLTGITFGNVFAGYRRQSVDDSSLSTISGPTVGFDLTWNISTLTTIKGSLEKTVEETTTAGSSGIFRTKSSVSIDHELLRNMILSGNYGYTYNEFEGIDRTDKEPSFEFGVDYKLNRNVYSELKYNYSSRTSTTESSEYDQHVFMIKFTAQL